MCSDIIIRVNDKIVGEKSILDHIIVAEELIPYIKNMELNSLRLGVPIKVANDALIITQLHSR